MSTSEPSSLVAAWRKARARQQVAADLEGTLLDVIVQEAKEAGTSIRELSRELDVPKSTLARYWRGPRQSKTPPVWGNPIEYDAAQRAIWSHDPTNAHAMLGHCPWIWEDTPAGRSVHAVPLLNIA